MFAGAYCAVLAVLTQATWQAGVSAGTRCNKMETQVALHDLSELHRGSDKQDYEEVGRQVVLSEGRTEHG